MSIKVLSSVTSRKKGGIDEKNEEVISWFNFTYYNTLY